MGPSDRIGVTIIAGFLGSGKTTLLRRIVRDGQVGPEAAVIVNELGALGLDEELIAAEARTPSLHMRQLASGCICCTLRGGLYDALRELSERSPPPRHIFIETSGAARASEVSYAVNAIGFEAPFQTDAVVTLVDAWSARRAHREHGELFEDQLRAADLVLLNKGDLVPGAAERAALLEELRPLAPRATWLWTERAALDPALLVGQPRRGDDDGGARGADGAHLEHRGHDPGEATHGLRAVTVPAPRPLLREVLEEELEGIADSVFRVKGVVDVREPDGRIEPLLVQAVGDRIELDFVGDSALARAARRLIFIGAGLEPPALQALVERSLAPGA